MPPRLSVNVNKVATVRNSRGGAVPSVLEAVSVCIAAGAPGITVHPRADQRHITRADVYEVAARESFARYAAVAERAVAGGMAINAGHDLDLHNLPIFRELPHLVEVSIGHALI